eukprot:bmy_17007T0
MVSKILHKFYVEVTEESMEAAADTGVETVLASLPIYEHFYCDYPFSLSSTTSNIEMKMPAWENEESLSEHKMMDGFWYLISCSSHSQHIIRVHSSNAVRNQLAVVGPELPNNLIIVFENSCLQKKWRLILLFTQTGKFRSYDSSSAHQWLQVIFAIKHCTVMGMVASVSPPTDHLQSALDPHLQEADPKAENTDDDRRWLLFTEYRLSQKQEEMQYHSFH